MSTRSEIGIINQDGTIESIYCHWDGYPAYNGLILFVYYNSEEKIRQLIKHGDLSSLGENIEPNKESEHSFDNPQDDVCVYYHRDRSEEWECTKPRIYKNISEWKKEVAKGWQDYIYLFQNKRWYFSSVKYTNWKELTADFLRKELTTLDYKDRIKILDEFIENENKRATTMQQHDDSNATPRN